MRSNRIWPPRGSVPPPLKQAVDRANIRLTAVVAIGFSNFNVVIAVTWGLFALAEAVENEGKEDSVELVVAGNTVRVSRESL